MEHKRAHARRCSSGAMKALYNLRHARKTTDAISKDTRHQAVAAGCSSLLTCIIESTSLADAPLLMPCVRCLGGGGGCKKELDKS